MQRWYETKCERKKGLWDPGSVQNKAVELSEAGYFYCSVRDVLKC